MAQYKVIQDIEAEDKLLGPLTLRQFIYAIIVVLSLFMGFKMLSLPGVGKYLVVLLIPHTVFFAVLAAPFGHDQSNEVWLLAKIRFFFKPRRRIWDQSGLLELVTITVPKKIEKQLTKGFSQEEARSRLKALANTIDTRGWAVKNVDTNLFQQPAYSLASSDRLVDVSTMPQEVPIEEISPTYDVLDTSENPTASHMSQLISNSEQQHRQQLTTMVSNAAQSTTTSTPAQTTPASDGINWFSDAPAAQIQPDPTPQTQVQPQAGSPVTGTTNPAILNLATNDDLNISTIAREADKATDGGGSDEVVISLR